MKQPTDAVSINLRDIRAARKLSLDKLSDLTGVSKSMLRQIETGNSSPTIATIWKIANGLKISFTSLLREPSTEAVVKDFKQSDPLTAASDHYRLYPLIPFDPKQNFETYYMEIDPGTRFEGEPHQGNVYEYVFVQAGHLEIAVEDKSYQISEKQFLQFKADVPHIYTCVGDVTASVIMQITYLD
ncbi:MAG: XRE family transcriptional regulator [Desulfobacterales bacterium]|nr:XRE family transcriptional regulator [Desulfobacterales bacterium]